MATYKQIQEYVKLNRGFTPKSCWIAHAKEIYGLPVKTAWNRKGHEREIPCPAEKLEAIHSAFVHFGMV